MRNCPRSGKPSPSARSSPSCKRAVSPVPTRIMLGSSTASARRRPCFFDASRILPTIGASPRTTASPPSRRFASIANARPARSVTKPTDVTAITASTSAATRIRMSPAARSRRSWRHANGSNFRAGFKAGFTPTPAGRCPTAAHDGSAKRDAHRASPAPAWCRHHDSFRTTAR